MVDNYTANAFFDRWDFFSGNDPTHGYVNYLTKSEAQQKQLSYVDNGVFYMKADSTTTASGLKKKFFFFFFLTIKIKKEEEEILLESHHKKDTTEDYLVQKKSK